MATPEEIQARIAEIEARINERNVIISNYTAQANPLPGTDIRAARPSQTPLNTFLPEGVQDFIGGNLPKDGVIRDLYNITPGGVIDTAEAVAGFGGPLTAIAAPAVGQLVEQSYDYFAGDDPFYVPDLGGMAIETGMNALPFGADRLRAAAQATGGVPSAAYVAGKEATQKIPFVGKPIVNTLERAENAVLGSPVRTIEAAQYADDPMVQQALMAAEAQQRTGQSPYGILSRPAEKTDPLSKQGQNAINEMTALSEGQYATGAATGVAPRVNNTGQGIAERVTSRQDPIYDTGLFTNGPEIDLFAEGPVARFKPGPAPMDLDDTVYRMAMAKDTAIQARDTAARELDDALQVLAARPKDPTQALRGIKFQDFADSFDQLRAKAKGLMMNTPTEGEGQALLKTIADLEADFDKVRSQVMMRKPSYGVISGAQEMGELLPSEAAQMLSNFNRARRTLGEFDTNTIARALAGNAGKMGEYQTLIDGYATISNALREQLDDVSEKIITQAKDHPNLSTNRALMAVEKYDPQFVRRMNSTYSALDPMETALANRSREVAQAMGPGAAKGLNAVVADAAQIPGSKMGAITQVANKAIDLVTNPLSPGAQKQALLRQAQTDPIQQLKFFAMMREGQAMPRLPRSLNQIVKDTKANNVLISSLIGLNIITSPEQWVNAPAPQKEQMIEFLGSIQPQMFQPNKDGYQSEFNGVIRSPVEQSMHLRQALDSGDLKTQTDIFDSLNQGGRYRPLPNTAPTPAFTPPPPVDPLQGLMGAEVDLSPDPNGVWRMGGETAQMIDTMKRSSGAYNSGY